MKLISFPLSRNILLLSLLLLFFCNCKKNDENEKLNTFTDTRDGNVYKTVQIGTQLWMAENLRFLPDVSNPTVGLNTQPFYYVYQYLGKATENGYIAKVSEAKYSEHYQSYGVLYNWNAAAISCPAGWHLPSDEEWFELTNFLGGDTIVAGVLKDATYGFWRNPFETSFHPQSDFDSTATNSSGFTALPGGLRNHPGGTFGGMIVSAFFWTSSEISSAKAYCRSLYENSKDVERRDSFDKAFGMSVRCVKNE